MRFRKGIHYEHPPRGRARKPYTMSEAARRQRCRNLRRTRIRSDRETAIIKRLIWQFCFSGAPARSQRTEARELGVRRSYVHKVQEQGHSVGTDVLANARRVTLNDLIEARRFTERIREEGLLRPRPSKTLSNAPRVMTADEGPRSAATHPSSQPTEYVIPERYRDLDKWKERYYAEHPWLPRLH
jgi:hypothetical protein